jgi:hypothetical protein
MTELETYLRVIDKLRTEIEATLNADEHSAWHIKSVNASMGLLHGAAAAKGKTSDQKLEVLALFAVRLFNDMASAVDLVYGGLYQQAVLPVRDLYEVGQLLRLFQEDESHILRWSELSDDERWNQYRPGKVFKALAGPDAADGVENGKRGKVYAMLSKAGGHFNLGAMKMLISDNQLRVGPFNDVVIGRATLYEVAKWGHLTTSYLMPFFSDHVADEKVLDEFQKIGREWAARYA